MRNSLVASWLCTMVVACGGESARTVPNQPDPIPCNLTPWSCLEASPIEIAGLHPLDAGHSAFNDTLSPSEYVQPNAPGCDRQLVFDLGPEDLAGETLAIGIEWPVDDAALANECRGYDAVVHVYGPDGSGSAPLVDYRVLEPGERCSADSVAAGRGDGLVNGLETSNIFLDLRKHQGGLRVVGSVLTDCSPANLRVTVSEKFP